MLCKWNEYKGTFYARDDPSFSRDAEFRNLLTTTGRNGKRWGEGSASPMTQTHDSVLLDVIGLRGSHVNSRLAVAHVYLIHTRVRGLSFAAKICLKIARSAHRARTSRNISARAHRLTFEEFHEAFGETKASRCGHRRGNDGHSSAAYRGHRARVRAYVRAFVLRHDSFGARM